MKSPPLGRARQQLRRRAHMASLRLRRGAIDKLFSTLAKAGGLSRELRLARRAVEIDHDVPYGAHPVAHRLDVYRPRYAARPLPVLLYIHGGAFVLCSKETHSSIALINAEEAGYLVFNINYRLAPSHPFPAAIADACDAYRWVVENCARFGGDPGRIVVAGESAGGNLALGVGVAACYRRPEPYARAVFDTGVAPVGLMPLMPYLQASDPLRRLGQPGMGFFSMSVVKDIALAYLGSHGAGTTDTLMADPVRVLEECGAPDRTFPEVFSGVGTADLCCSDVRRLEAACVRLGLPIHTYYYENEIHAFHALRWRAAARRFWHESIAFMRQIAATGDVDAPLPAVASRTLLPSGQQQVRRPRRPAPPRAAGRRARPTVV